MEKRFYLKPGLYEGTPSVIDLLMTPYPPVFPRGLGDCTDRPYFTEGDIRDNPTLMKFVVIPSDE